MNPVKLNCPLNLTHWSSVCRTCSFGLCEAVYMNTVQLWATYCKLVPVGGDCGHVPACSPLWKDSRRRGFVGFMSAPFTWRVQQPSSRTIRKWSEPARRAVPPSACRSLKKTASASCRRDSNQLTWKLWPNMEWPPLIRAKPRWPRESHLKGENPVDQQNQEASLPLSVCLAHSCLVPSETGSQSCRPGHV